MTLMAQKPLHEYVEYMSLEDSVAYEDVPSPAQLENFCVICHSVLFIKRFWELRTVVDLGSTNLG